MKYLLAPSFPTKAKGSEVGVVKTCQAGKGGQSNKVRCSQMNNDARITSTCQPTLVAQDPSTVARSARTVASLKTSQNPTTNIAISTAIID